jgi:hemerythrin-like domain-containing protein
MIEHRLIEKMISIINKKILEIEKKSQADPDFIDTAVDFIRIYADKTHHGKEEDILFRECKEKDMSEEDTKMMNELIEEHKFGRKVVAELMEVKKDYLENGRGIETIVEKLKILADFYPKHIKKEDDAFFPNSETYFSDEEQQAMLKEFWDFDKDMIHEKYKMVVEQLQE